MGKCEELEGTDQGDVGAETKFPAKAQGPKI